MRTFWKAYQVYFPMVPFSSILEFQVMRYVQISKYCSEGQQVFPGQNVGETSYAKLYQSTMFRDACCTWMESLLSLLLHPINGSSF
jgi:hypothetical protein